MWIKTREISIAVSELAKLIEGRGVGDGTKVITGLCALETPHQNHLSFLREANPERLARELRKEYGALIISNALTIDALQVPFPVIQVKDPQAAWLKVLRHFFHLSRPAAEISPRAEISPSAKIGKNVFIGAFSVIGAGVTVEDDVVIYPQVTVYHGATIGARSILHSTAVVREGCKIGADSVVQNGAIIGADGFGYHPGAEGLEAVPQLGVVITEKRVDLGANACIDRGALGSTHINYGTKIDNLVQVGHNVIIGKHTILCGQVGVSGSCVIGDQVVLAGGVGVGDHISIVSGSRIAGGSGVIQDINEKGDYAGYPAQKVHAWRKSAYILNKLPRLLKKLGVSLKDLQTRDDKEEKDAD